jgi:hypothetical protein
MRQFILLQSLIASLLLSNLPAEVHQETETRQESPIDGYIIQYDATITSSKVWISWDGDEHVCLFTLSDGTRWITTSEQAFHAVIKSRWSAGDHLSIKLEENCWKATNTNRDNAVPLQQLCNKGGSNI